MSSKEEQHTAGPGEVDEQWHELHDYMNLSTIPFIIFSNLYYLYVNRSDMYFWLQFFIFAAYLFVDTLWVVIIPRSVASPKTILIHHLVTIIGWLLPVIFGMHLAEWCAVGLLVEINTWTLIARRTFRHVFLFTPMFYASWVSFRLIYYPLKGYQFIVLTWSNYASNRSVDVGSILYLLLWAALTFLNFKWTFDLLLKTLRKSKTGEKEEHSKGL